ncbi:MAG TPA: hypothetical protein V6C72_18460, partial [Chroococcales cyanobacterium]
RTFFDHLTPSGVLTISRWYFKERPGEIYRLMTMTTTTLKRLGVENPRRHVIIVGAPPGGNGGRAREGIATVLVSRSPFSKEDIKAVEKFALDKQFQVILSPESSADSTLAGLADAKESEQIIKNYPINIAPCTDDTPFFFYMVKLKDMANLSYWNAGNMGFHSVAISVLGVLLFTVIFLTTACIFLPLLLTLKSVPVAGSMPLLSFFAAIGFAFMLIEISQMQRLIVFLGHPVYGLTVVLFTLLSASGLGSFTTSTVRFDSKKWSWNSPYLRLALLIAALIIFGLTTPGAIAAFASAGNLMRIAVAVGILFPLGFFMGMPFPLGMMAAGERQSGLTPWFWGINGATSVCSSVVAIALALSFGISATFWIGCGFYVLTLPLLWWSQRAQPTSS